MLVASTMQPRREPPHRDARRQRCELRLRERPVQLVFADEENREQCARGRAASQARTTSITTATSVPCHLLNERDEAHQRCLAPSASVARPKAPTIAFGARGSKR